MQDNDEMLARMIGQIAERGGDVASLRALVEEASETGAGRALARLGLADEGAREDVRELRQLLGAWREAKKSALRAAIGWVARILLALVLLGLAVRFGLMNGVGR